jgi:hypothetical protein
MSAAELAAGGPLAAGSRDAYRRLIAEIARGASLHYETVTGSADPDLDLLLGDQAYANGLSLLAELGDLQATAQLADVISLVAEAHAAGDRELARAIWEAGAVAVGWGTTAALEQAKKCARAGAKGAAAALQKAAQTRREAEK